MKQKIEKTVAALVLLLIQAFFIFGVVAFNDTSFTYTLCGLVLILEFIFIAGMVVAWSILTLRSGYK